MSVSSASGTVLFVAKGRSELSPEEGERVRTAIGQLLTRSEYRKTNDTPNYAALGRDLDLTGQALSQMLDGKNDPSFLTAKKVAEKIGVPWATLLVGEPPAPPTRVVVYDERYPNLSSAVVAARALGISEEAIERVHSVALSRDDDPSAREWLRKLEATEDDVRREHLRLQGDVDRANRQREADAKRAADMEQLTKPNLRRKARK